MVEHAGRREHPAADLNVSPPPARRPRRMRAPRILPGLVCGALSIIFATIAVLSAIPALASDPTGFTPADIGADYGYGFTAGTDSYSSGVLTVTGSGFGPVSSGNGSVDQFHYTYATVPANTNFRLICEVTGVSTASGTAPQVGLAIRAGTADVEPEGGVLFAPLAGYGNQSVANEFGNFQWDTPSTDPIPSAPGVGWANNVYGPAINPPFWLELIKVGNNFATYRSADGANWTMIADGMSGGVYQASGPVDVGFVVCGGFSGTTDMDDAAATATFSNISLNESAVLPYETSWIGDTLSGDVTAWVDSSVAAMWVDSSGDCFTNFQGFENDLAPQEFTNGAVNKDFATNYTPWSVWGFYGYGWEGSITGDNAGNIYLWGVNGRGASNPGLFMAATSGTTVPTALGTTTAINIATGMAWDSSNSLLYVSDPEENEILAINPAQTGSSQEVTADDFAFTPDRPGPITVDGSGRIWIIQEGETPGSDAGGGWAVGTPNTIYTSGVYCYNTSGVQQSIKIGDLTDSTKVYQADIITGATDASPIVITTVNQTGLATGNSVTINGVEGNTAANGTWTITVTSPTTFSLNSSTGNGAYTFGGNVSMPSGVSVHWDPTAICYDSSTNQLMVTDNGPDQNVKVFNLTGWTSGTKSSASSSYGAAGGVFAGATPGLITDASGNSNRFFGPVGIGTDSSGNIYVAENYNFSKINPMGDVRALTTSGSLKWDLSGLTWVDCGDFDQWTGDEYTINQHYRMNYAAGSGGEWSEYSYLWDPFLQATIPGNYYEQTNITRRIDGNLYLFTTQQGLVEQIDIYRLNGEQIVPCGSIAGYDFWDDTNADGIQENDEVSTTDIPYQDFDVDSNGNIWIDNGSSGYDSPFTLTEIKLQSVTSGVPIYNVASDTATYTVPQPFTDAVWTTPKFRYIASSDTLYVFGDVYTFTDTDTRLATVARINNFTSASPTLAWTFNTPVPDTTPLEFMNGTYEFWYNGFDVANDKVFVGEQWGPVHIYDANTGAFLGLLQVGPEVSANSAWDDCYKGMHAYYNPATNEYAVAEENSGDSGRQNMFRWSPFAGSPSVKSFAISGATNASPIVVTTSTAHGLVTGQTVVINGVLGNTAANGTWTVTVVNTTKIDLTTNWYTGTTSTGNAAYKSGTGTLIYGGVPGDQDIDTPGDAGSASQTAGTYTVKGGGAGYGLSGGADQLNLAWTQMDGNATISAQVTGLSGSTAAAASAGIMIRNAIGTAGTDPEVSLVVTKSNGLVFQYRAAAAGTTTTAATLSGISPSSDEFVMLQRSTTTNVGDTFTAYYSTKGGSWTQLGSPVVFTTPMNLTTYAGLAVTAALNTSLATGTFDRELLDYELPAVPPAPTGFMAVNSNGGIGTSWSYVTNALTYNVYRGTTSGGETLLASGIPTFSYLDTTAVNATTYYYEMTAVGTGGESAKSNEVQVTYQTWNPSFEWPVDLVGSGFLNSPPDDAWTMGVESGYTGGAGVGVAGCGQVSAPIPNGAMCAYLEDYAYASQTLTGFTSNTTYTVTFWAAQNAGNTDPQAISVTIDGTQYDLVTPPSSTAFTEYTFTYATGSSDPGSHTLDFLTTDPSNVYCEADLDDISFSPPL